ncbi:MAG: hypothetical protein HC831_15355 [Chloroflexia bacterium]|nr:hypothetical protein [Chloroflexia bacterium]
MKQGFHIFFQGIYPSNGCLCGYVLQGNQKNIIKKLNEILEEKSLSCLEQTDPINNHEMIYNLKDGYQILTNFFVEFSN